MCSRNAEQRGFLVFDIALGVVEGVSQQRRQRHIIVGTESEIECLVKKGNSVDASGKTGQLGGQFKMPVDIQMQPRVLLHGLAQGFGNEGEIRVVRVGTAAVKDAYNLIACFFCGKRPRQIDQIIRHRVTHHEMGTSRGGGICAQRGRAHQQGVGGFHGPEIGVRGVQHDGGVFVPQAQAGDMRGQRRLVEASCAW